MQTIEKTELKNRTKFQARDLLKQVAITTLAMANDGETVVYSRRTIEDNKYVQRLWRTTYRGGKPDQLTTGKSTDGRPRFSPDGKSIVFISDRSGKPQAWLMSLTGGEPRQLTDLEGGVAVAEWSPDGQRLLLIGGSGEKRFVVGKADDPTARRILDYTWRLDGLGYRDEFSSLWIADVNGGKPRRLTAPTYEVGSAAWSPDGRHIAFVADLRAEASLEELPTLWTIDAKTGGAKPQNTVNLRGAIFFVAWAPSDHMAFLGIDREGAPEWSNVSLHVSDGGRPEQLAPDRDLTIWNTSFSDFEDPSNFFPPVAHWIDRQHVLGLVSHHGATHPYRFGTDGSMEKLAEPNAICYAAATGGGRIAVLASTDAPQEIYAVEDGRLRPITTDGGKWFGPFRRNVEHVSIPHHDGHHLDAWLLRANGQGTRGPTVIKVHGGPYLAYGPTPGTDVLALADAGINAIWSNPRGSSGYGEDFCRAVDGHWGDPDASDILCVVEWAVDEGLADKDRIGIFGLSYGGFMTNWMLGHHPGIFKAAVSENPVTDVLGEFAASDGGRIIGRLAAGFENPWEHLEALLERSPYTKIHHNKAPLLLIQSENDLRCPPGQTEMVFAILKSLGREVEMIRYPGESHLMIQTGRPDRRVDRIERIVAWFQRHLGAEHA